MTGCANCGHDSQWHSDGEYIATGECVFQLNNEKNDTSKMEFCKCKEFIKSTSDEVRE